MKTEQQFINESNAYLRLLSKDSGISTESLGGLWDSCVKQIESKHGKESRKTESFWREVKENFDKRMLEIDMMEAKYNMDNKQKLRKEIESFLDNMVNDNYDRAKQGMPGLVNSKIKEMVAARREDFMKELGNKAQRKAKEA